MIKLKYYLYKLKNLKIVKIVILFLVSYFWYKLFKNKDISTFQFYIALNVNLIAYHFTIQLNKRF